MRNILCRAPPLTLKIPVVWHVVKTGRFIPISGFPSKRTNLSPFTKDFRGGEHSNEYSRISYGHHNGGPAINHLDIVDSLFQLRRRRFEGGGGGNRPPPREIQIINLKNCIIWSILATQQKWTISVLTYVPIWGGGAATLDPLKVPPRKILGTSLDSGRLCLWIHTVNRLSSAAAATAS